MPMEPSTLNMGATYGSNFWGCCELFLPGKQVDGTNAKPLLASNCDEEAACAVAF
jgi:hypothetical protein